MRYKNIKRTKTWKELQQAKQEKRDLIAGYFVLTFFLALVGLLGHFELIDLIK